MIGRHLLSPCHGARLDGAISDGIPMGYCQECNKPIVRQLYGRAPEWIDDNGPWTTKHLRLVSARDWAISALAIAIHERSMALVPYSDQLPTRLEWAEFVVEIYEQAYKEATEAQQVQDH